MNALLLAADLVNDFGLSTTQKYVALAIILAVVLAFLILLIVARFFKRCSSNEILVIYGKAGGEGQAAKCIHGGATFVWPLIQDYAKLGLEPMQIAIPLRDALSMENIRVNVPSVFTVAIGTTPEMMQNAAIRLLGLSVAEIEKQAADMIFGQLRQVIASMKIEDINRDRDKFLTNIQESLDPELRKIGLVLINVNITDITDESGYIEAIGRKAASEAIQKARGDVADNEKMGAIRVADAQREQDVQVANATKLREIGTREALREQAVRVAELDKEQQVGEQTASFQRQAQVKQAERDMRIELADADARAIEGENTAKAAVADSMATLQVKKAEAYQLGETRKVQAEAAVIEAENLAQAKAALAEAKRVEAKQRAELEAPAIAQKARVIVDAEAEAERRRIEAEGQAAAIFAQLEAKARGQYEMLAKKGEGLRTIIDACGGAQQAFQLLMLEHFDNLVDASARAISNIKFDKVVVWEGNGKNGKSSTADWLQNMARTLPPMLQVMKDIGGIEIPETLAKFDAVNPHETDGKKPEPAAEHADKADDHFDIDLPDANAI
ncbi:MAG: flotillin family protein [Pirellulales bacterium]|nr:flotillin family protein [Pirellulales bacterium]